jgi:cytochrome c556
MRKLTEVEEAKALMAEAVEWSVMRWLKEKKRVRKTADRANHALEQLSKETKQLWSEELRAAYSLLAQNAKQPGAEIPSAVKQVKRADDESWRAHLDAEKTFDEAERQLSTSMAREGCRKAIYSWELHEKAIRMAERLIPSQQGQIDSMLP